MSPFLSLASQCNPIDFSKILFNSILAGKSCFYENISKVKIIKMVACNVISDFFPSGLEIKSINMDLRKWRKQLSLLYPNFHSVLVLYFLFECKLNFTKSTQYSMIWKRQWLYMSQGINYSMLITPIQISISFSKE